MDKQQFSSLYQAFLEDQISPEELVLFRQLCNQQPYEQWLEELLEETVTLQFTELETPDIDLSHMRNHLLTNVAGVKTQRRPVKYFYAAAASLLVLMAAAVYLWFTPERTTNQTATEQPEKQQDILPAKELATLTMADGTAVLLDSAGIGRLSQSGSATVSRAADGSLIYDTERKKTDGTITLNTLSTPRGGQFQLILPDGTRAWLNAASAVTFPTAFTGKTRKVKVTGEAYLEVRRDQQHPFIVDLVGGATVEVLGTSFNVNAYADGANITTTLLEGSISVSHGKAVVIKPGQQAVIRTGTVNAPEVVNGADLQKVMAWKNGFFNFDNMPLSELMKQLERWYDIDVKYDGPAPAVTFKGGMDRGVQLSGIIRFLHNFGVNAKLEGRTLIVTRK